jgi:hypothetical protein
VRGLSRGNRLEGVADQQANMSALGQDGRTELSRPLLRGVGDTLLASDTSCEPLRNQRTGILDGQRGPRSRTAFTFVTLHLHEAALKAEGAQRRGVARWSCANCDSNPPASPNRCASALPLEPRAFEISLILLRVLGHPRRRARHPGMHPWLPCRALQ